MDIKQKIGSFQRLNWSFENIFHKLKLHSEEDSGKIKEYPEGIYQNLNDITRPRENILKILQWSFVPWKSYHISKTDEPWKRKMALNTFNAARKSLLFNG